MKIVAIFTAFVFGCITIWTAVYYSFQLALLPAVATVVFTFKEENYSKKNLFLLFVGSVFLLIGLYFGITNQQEKELPASVVIPCALALLSIVIASLHDPDFVDVAIFALIIFVFAGLINSKAFWGVIPPFLFLLIHAKELPRERSDKIQKH